MLAKAVCQLPKMLKVLPSSRASLAPTGSAVAPPNPVGAGLARDGVLESSVIIPAISDVLLQHDRIGIMPRRKLALQIPRKRNNLGNRAV